MPTDQQPLTDMLTEQERAVLLQLPREVDTAADAARVHLISRTGRGIGTNERRFRDYSEQYALKEKGGRLQPVTLIRRGDMMGSLTVVPEGKLRRVLKFSDRRQERKARAHQFGTRRGLPQRRWFGLTTRFARQLFEAFARRMETALPRDRRRRLKITFSL